MLSVIGFVERDICTKFRCVHVHVCLCTECSDYAKHVAVLIERIGLLVDVCLLAAGADLMNEVAEAMSRGYLFALTITGQHQLSATLYILHGEPEGAAYLLMSVALARCS